MSKVYDTLRTPVAPPKDPAEPVPARIPEPGTADPHPTATSPEPAATSPAPADVTRAAAPRLRQRLPAADRLQALRQEVRDAQGAQRAEARQLAAERRHHERLTQRLRTRLTRSVERIRQLEAAAAQTAPPATPVIAAESAALRERVGTLEEEARQATQLLEHAARELTLQKQASTAVQAATVEAAALRRRAEAAEIASVAAASELERFRSEFSHWREQQAAERMALDQRADTVTAELLKTARQLEDAIATERSLREELQRERAAVAEARAALAQARQAVAAAEPVTWRLRLPDGSSFGPVTNATFEAWVAEARIGPAHEVSRNGQDWIPARDVPALRMDWNVTLPDGSTAGPLNVFALQYLLADGSIPPDAQLTHPRTGLRSPAAAARFPELLALREAAARQTHATPPSAAGAQAPGAPPKQLHHRLRKQA